MARKIVLTSGKGGVGKTTICANLGIQLAKLGFRVVLLDVDIGLNNLDVVMNIEDRIVFDITDVIMGRCRPKQALVQDKNISSLYVMPSFSAYNKTNILGEHIKNVIDQLDSGFDYILIDCPPVDIVADTQIIEKLADRTVFIVRAGLLERDMLPELQRAYNEKRYKNMAIILNGTDGGSSRYGYRYGYKYGYHYGYGSKDYYSSK